jgi:hypothetical protein
MRSRRWWGLTVALGLVIGLIAPSAQASAARNCVYHLDPIGRVGTVTKARLIKVGCYSTFAEAISAATGGAIRIDPSATPKGVADRDLNDRGTRGVVVIGTEWVGKNFGGSSNTYTASATCSQTNTWEISYVGDTWNDRFSSGKGFGGCDHNRKFQHANFGGDSIACTPNCDDYLSLSDEVSSLRWKP